MNIFGKAGFIGTVKLKAFLFLGVVSILSTVLLWMPFLLDLDEFWGIKIPPRGMETIVANYDGPFYIVAAKSLYNSEYITHNFSFDLPAIYYSAHYPFYPLLIRAIATTFPFISYPYAMIFVTVFSSILAAFMFYLLVRETEYSHQAIWLAILFLIFPARFLIIRSIGSPEPLFIFTIIACIYFFQKKAYWLASLFGVMAQLTKPPGILLFVGLLMAIFLSYWGQLAKANFSVWIRNFPWRAYPILLIPASLIGLWVWYGIQFGSFLAYFNSGDNIHLMFPPFQIFNPLQTWVGTFWLEEVVWIYLVGALGVVYLFKQKRWTMAGFGAVFFASLLFVSHRDLARYSLPLVPFLMIAFGKTLCSREFKWVLLVILIPIYLFSIAFITNNITPVADWGPLL